MNIGKALKQTRHSLDLRQNIVAEKTGLTQSYISSIENEQKVPSIEVIEKLCKLYKTPVAIVLWRAIDIKDVAPHKRQAYSSLRPTIDDMINRIF